MALGHQLDVIVYRFGFPIGVVRMTLQDDSAHIVAQAIMKEVRTPELMQQLLSAAVRIAQDAGCDMVFLAGSTDEERQLVRNMGFEDFGSVVRYAVLTDIQTDQEIQNDNMAQPVLII